MPGELDRRPPWAREKYFEGDLRTWYAEVDTIDQGVQTDDLWEIIPATVRSEIAEVLEVHYWSQNLNTVPVVDGAIMAPANWQNTGAVLPIHKPKLTFAVANTGGAAYSYSWALLYRLKVAGKE